MLITCLMTFRKIEKNRNALNFWLTGESLLQHQIEDLNWEIQKLEGVSERYRKSLTILTANHFRSRATVSLNDLLSITNAIHKLEEEFNSKEALLTIEQKLYALAHISLTMNETLLKYSIHVNQHLSTEIKEW